MLARLFLYGGIMARIYTNDGYDWGGATGNAPTVTTRTGNPNPTLHDYGAYTSPYTGPSGPTSQTTTTVPGEYNPTHGVITKKGGGTWRPAGSETVPGSTGNYGYSGYSDTGVAVQSNPMADYIAALQAARADAIAKANAAVDAQTSAAEGRYRNQLIDIGKDYQDLRNQSEVNRYKAIRRQMEALANQGRLDGGAGRMENTVLRNNFDNNLNEINLKEASEKRQVESAINELYAQAAALKAQNEMATLTNFGDALMYGMQSNPSYAYNPSTSDYYTAASNLANTSYTPINAVSDGQTARASTAALQQAFEELSRNPLSIGDYIKKFSWI